MLTSDTKSAMAEFDAQKLSYYRPLMSEMSGSSQRRHLHSIDAHRPQGSSVEIEKKIESQEFLKIMEGKIKNTVTFDGSKLRCVVFKNAVNAGELDVKLKTSSVVEAVEYYCSITGNVWLIEQREDGVTLIIRSQNDNANKP
jgi:hypothetical protein